MPDFPRVAKLTSTELLHQHVTTLPIKLSFDETIETGSNATLAAPIQTNKHRIGNRFCILPMEGWDGTADGKPTDYTRRRWQRFGQSGAKLIWGGEAVAVRHDGRANPNQLLINDSTLADIEDLRSILVVEHEKTFGNIDDLSVGLQLTHSGRFARPNDKKALEPKTIYQHPLLDEKFNVDASRAILSDDEMETLIDDFIAAAVMAQKSRLRMGRHQALSRLPRS